MKVVKLILLLISILIGLLVIVLRVRFIELPPYQQVYIQAIEAQSIDGRMHYEVDTCDKSGRPSGVLSMSEASAIKAKKGRAVHKIVDYTSRGRISNLYVYETRFIFIDMFCLAIIIGLLWIPFKMLRKQNR